MSTREERVKLQLARWRDDLLDLTGRNRLLRFRHTKTASLELASPDAQEILDRLLTGRSREWTIHVPPDEELPADDLDPTASKLALGPADRAPSTAAAVVEVLDRLGSRGVGLVRRAALAARRHPHRRAVSSSRPRSPGGGCGCASTS